MDYFLFNFSGVQFHYTMSHNDLNACQALKNKYIKLNYMYSYETIVQRYKIKNVR